MHLRWGHGGAGLLLLLANGGTLPDLVQVAHTPLCCFLQPLRQACLQLLCMLHTSHTTRSFCVCLLLHVYLNSIVMMGDNSQSRKGKAESYCNSL